MSPGNDFDEEVVNAVRNTGSCAKFNHVGTECAQLGPKRFEELSCKRVNREVLDLVLLRLRDEFPEFRFPRRMTQEWGEGRGEGLL